MSQVQSGILPEHCRAAIWIEANVKGEVDALRAASKTFADKLATFEAKFPDAHLGAVVAFGNNTWRALSGGVGAEELKDFPGYGKGLAPTTQFDVLIHILSLRHDVNFSVAQAAMEAFGDCIEVKEEIHGFRWVEERDLSGFVDGTENPAGEETRREVAVIKDGVDAGGSYVFVQRWEHNLKQLNRMSVHDQEMMIGRTKEANEEIDGDERPETSHLTRVDLKEDGKGLKIVRQSLPYGFTFDGTIIITVGLLAIAKCFAVKVTKRCTDFNTGVSRNIAIQHINAADRALIAVNHHRHVVAFHHFKKRTTLPFAVFIPLRRR